MLKVDGIKLILQIDQSFHPCLGCPREAVETIDRFLEGDLRRVLRFLFLVITVVVFVRVIDGVLEHRSIREITTGVRSEQHRK